MSDNDYYLTDGGHPSWGNGDTIVAGHADAYNDGYQRGYEEGKRDALLEKENLKITTLIGYEVGYEEGAKSERERVLKKWEDWILDSSYAICPGNRSDAIEIIESLRSKERE